MRPLALHGALGEPDDWDSVVAAGIELEAIDLFSSHGGLAAAVGGNLLDAGRAVAARWGASGERVLAGYSLGGRIALQALLADKADWKGAVILAAHPGLEDEAERRVRLKADAVWAEKLVRLDPGKFLEQWDAQRVFAGEAAGRTRSKRVPLPGGRWETMAACFGGWSLGAQKPLWPRLSEIAVPVTWMVGEQDLKFLALAKRAVSLLPRGRLVVVAGCGHRLLLEAPDAVAEELEGISLQ